MSLRDRFFTFLVLSTLAVIPGCGSSNAPAPPPSGAFSNSNLNGTYVFSFSGVDATNGNESFFAVVGTLVANGSGSFTSGTVDVNDPSLGAALGTSGVATGLATTGKYNVTADGRGTGTITVTINQRGIQFGLDFVLTNSSHGLITRFDAGGSGSGSIDLQASGITQASLQGSYAIGLSGVDLNGHPLGTVGSFTLTASGTATGLQDFNDDGNSANLQALALVSPSTVLVGSPSGTAQLTTSAAAFGTLNFDVWAVDSTHLKFIETDEVAALAGDAFVSTGQTSFPSGNLVFTAFGIDNATNPFAAGGVMTSDGSSLITGGLQDVNDAGTVVQAPSISGGFSSANGRTQLTLNGIYNGGIMGSTLFTGTYIFAAYPYAGGIELLEIDGLGVTAGVAFPQSSTSITASQGYGLNLSGENSNGETDWIAQFNATSTSLSGLYDANNLGTLISDHSLGTGSYSIASNGRGTASFPSLQTNGNSLIGELSLTFYTVNSSTVVFIETDSNQLGAGSFQLQNASSSSAAQSRPVILQRSPSFHGFRR